MKRVSVVKTRHQLEKWIELEQKGIARLQGEENPQLVEMRKEKLATLETIVIILDALKGDDTMLRIVSTDFSEQV